MKNEKKDGMKNFFIYIDLYKKVRMVIDMQNYLWNENFVNSVKKKQIQ